MAWEWNHTDAAVEYAMRQVLNMSRRDLIEIAAEWRMHDLGRPDDMWPNEWPKALAFTRRKFAGRPTVILAAYVWSRARDQATCENGGWSAHTCPYECMPHSVPFGPEDQVDLSEVYTYC